MGCLTLVRSTVNRYTTDGLKICRICRVSKPVSEYGSHSRTADRLVHECKTCEKERLHLSYLKHREKVLKACKDRRKKHPELNYKYHLGWKRNRPKSAIICSAKARAKLKGIPFDITEDDIDIPESCPIFPWIKLEMNKGRADSNSPSLDRFKPQLGYVKGNVRVISRRANVLEGDATIEEMRRLVEWMEDIEANLGVDLE